MSFRLIIVAAIIATIAFADTSGSSGTLVYSTYLRGGFAPAAIATDATGNVYLTGNVVVHAITNQTGVLVEKLNPQGTQQIYVRYLAGSGSDSAGAIAVDNAGSAYVVGTAYSVDFPVTTGASPGTASTDPRRSFLTKFDANGEVVFSTLLGGAVPSAAQAVALTPQGQILVSGTANGSGFPATVGAYSVPDSSGRPYLIELDASGSKVIFSATGIGGSAIALDPSGNIYVAGNTARLDYPTTPGAYQTTFYSKFFCFGLCQIGFAGVNQYVTKVNPAGSKLIYSTAVSDPTPGGGQIVNAGLAVDAAGNAYLTGIAWGDYPYTVAPPQGAPALPAFLTKLDSAGQNLLFSIPVGGAGAQVGLDGVVYAAGNYNAFNPHIFLGNPRQVQPLPMASVGIPALCQANNANIISEAYISRVDGTTGNVLGTQVIEGSNVTAIAIALAETKVWIAGSTSQADVPITPGALGPLNLRPGPLPGAYLGAMDFSQPTPASPAPQVGCIVDAANGSHVGPVAPNQLISLFGSNLGPAVGVAASNGSAESLSGVSVTFDSVPAKLLYVSSSQINVAVPKIATGQGSTVVQIVTSDGKTPPRRLPVTPIQPSLFTDLSNSAICKSSTSGTILFLAARDQDGAMNSCSAPAKAGSIVSVFLNGVGALQPSNVNLLPVTVTVGRWSAEVVNVAAENDFVTRVDFRLPVMMPEDLSTFKIEMTVSQNGADIPVGPFAVAQITGTNIPAGLPLNTNIWVKP
jgi:uncharacterized protein (TIGR03437 family)